MNYILWAWSTANSLDQQKSFFLINESNSVHRMCILNHQSCQYTLLHYGKQAKDTVCSEEFDPGALPLYYSLPISKSFPPQSLVRCDRIYCSHSD